MGPTGSVPIITTSTIPINPDAENHVLKVCPNNPAFHPEGHNEEAEKGSSSPEGEKNPGKEESDAEDTSDIADLQREKGVHARLRGCPPYYTVGRISC